MTKELTTKLLYKWIKILRLEGEDIRLEFEKPQGHKEWDCTWGECMNHIHLGYSNIHIHLELHDDLTRLEKTVIHELLHVKQMPFLNVVDCLSEQLTICENSLLENNIERFTEMMATILYSIYYNKEAMNG